DGCGEPEAVAADDAEACATETLIGSMYAPLSIIETATSCPSPLIAIGPSSGPSFKGNGWRTPAEGLSQYQAPVAAARTAIRPSSPGAAPCVKRFAWSGALARTFNPVTGLVRSSASTS